MRDQVDDVIAMMKSAVSRGTMELWNFRDWAVFLPLRSDPRFISAFEEAFGERLLLDVRAVRPQAEISDKEVDASHSEEPVLDSDEAQVDQTIH